MAKKEKNTPLNYSDELKRLKTGGPERLYLLYGEEQYLLRCFADELKKLCVAEDTEQFSYKRIPDGVPDPDVLEESVNALPFLSERSYVEAWGTDLNKCRETDAKRLEGIFSDIPDYCTVCFIMDSDWSPNGSAPAVKAVKKYGRVINFTAQAHAQLLNWVSRRFEALGKKISRSDAEYLTFVSGGLMVRLIPEIEKAAYHASGENVTREDIDATATRVPEVRVFEMIDDLGGGRYDKAAGMLSNLLAADEAPLKLLALITRQLTQIYAMKLCMERKVGGEQLKTLCEVSSDYVVNKMRSFASRFSLERLAELVELCTECDLRMKSSYGYEAEIMKELLLEMAVGKC